MASRILPKGWKEVELGSVLNRIKKPVDLNTSAMYREIGIRSHGKGIFYKQERTGESIGEKSVFWVEPDCFIVNIVFAWEQAIAKTTKKERGMIASHRFPMYKPEQGKLDLDYLVYFFNTPRGKHLLGLASPGGAGRNKTLGQQDFLNLSILLPSFEQQKNIVKILKTWDNAISLTEQLITTKQQLKRGVMQKLLSGKSLFPDNNRGKWNKKKLGDFLDIQYGKSPKTIKSDDGKYLVYGTGGVIGKTDMPLSNKPAVILGRKGTITQPIFAKEPFWAIDTTFYCTPNDDTNVNWLYYALSKINFQKYNEGSTIPSLSRSTLYGIELILPSPKAQKKIADFLSLCDLEIDLLNQKHAILRQQKKGLMQNLLTGQIRVKV